MSRRGERELIYGLPSWTKPRKTSIGRSKTRQTIVITDDISHFGIIGKRADMVTFNVFPRIHFELSLKDRSALFQLLQSSRKRRKNIAEIVTFHFDFVNGIVGLF